MKANEAPEKMYISYEGYGVFGEDGSTERTKNSQIEYTRTDTFIEKALYWLKNHYRDYMHNPTGKRLEAFFGIDMCNDFENYMRGE